ncbi:MoxR family ATPase [Candidatus Woesearchaeota archaeon]|nr:MoxR family ATPase [Candidatus Woesearchaeota archaeon]
MLAYKKLFDDIFEEVGKVIVGQQEMVTQLLSAIMADGNALLEGYPGLAKTLTVRTLARIMDLRFSRIQHTPDLMPSDITGTYILEESGGKREFKFHPGPVFANVVLADEINRSAPKTQSALLEAMQERQVTVGNTTYKLELPFFVLATQNPIEQEGTYNLPEAQADRFLLKIKVTYPSFDEEMEIVNRYAAEEREKKLRVVLSKEQLLDLQALTRQVPISSDIKQFIVTLINETRNRKDIIEYGASPRASTGLVLASKARALISGRNHVSIEDVRAMAYPVLRHRIILNFEAERKGLTQDGAVKILLDKVK